MALARDIFYSISGVSLAVLVIGTVTSPIAGCDRSFCLAPALNLAGQVLGFDPIQTKESASTPANSTPSPTTTAPNPEPSPLPLPDLRLSQCPDGSIEPTASEIPSTLARSLQRQIKSGLKFSQLIELQGRLGGPKCNYRQGETVVWRYLIRGGGGLIAKEIQGGVKVEFFDF
jgi:hypothetical protein